MAAVVTTSSKTSSVSRAYLRDPDHFDKIYKHLVNVLVQPQRNKTLTAAVMQYLSKVVQFDSRFVKLIMDALDLRKFIDINVVINNQEHIQAAANFLRTLSADARFAGKIYEIIVELVSIDFTRTIPPRNGYEAIIGMMHWVAPLDINRSLADLASTLYQRICKQTLKKHLTSDAIAFRTRFSRLLTNDQSAALNFVEDYPYDLALFKPLGSSKDKDSDSQSKKSAGSVNALEQAKLLRSVVLHVETDITLRSILYRANFDQPTELTRIKVFFGEQ